MFRKKRLFILIPTLLLIPLLLGMIPLKLVNKLAHGGPLAQSQSKHGCSHKNCSAHSLISQNNFDTTTMDAISPNHEVSYLLKALNAGPEYFHSNIHFSSIPLRC
ncbi:MAG: hypothetical protein ABFD82_22985 [Syntrophaceae bacterium]